MRRRELNYIAQSAIYDAHGILQKAVEKLEKHEPNNNESKDLGDNELPPIMLKIIATTLKTVLATLDATRTAISATLHCIKCNDLGEVYIPKCSMCIEERDTYKFIEHKQCDANGEYVRCTDCNPGRKLWHLKHLS